MDKFRHISSVGGGLNSDFTPKRPVFIVGAGHMKLTIDAVAMGQVFLSGSDSSFFPMLLSLTSPPLRYAIGWNSRHGIKIMILSCRVFSPAICHLDSE